MSEGERERVSEFDVWAPKMTTSSSLDRVLTTQFD